MTILSIPDMNCRHCEASVLAALTPLVTEVSVDLDARTAALVPKATDEALVAALARIGFPARVMPG